MIRFDFMFHGTVKEKKSIGRNFRAANFEGLKAHLPSEKGEGTTKYLA